MERESPPLHKLHAERLRQALELMEFGIQLMRQNIARKLPTSSEDHIDRELQRWIVDRTQSFVPQVEKPHE